MRYIGILLLTALTGCGLRLPFTDNDLARLRRERDEWRALSIHNYAYEYHKSCFCAPESTDPVRIEVRADTVTSVLNLRSQAAVSRFRYPGGLWPTIDSVFAEAEQTYEFGEYELEISYDGTYHFPSSFGGDIPNALDAGFILTATNFVKKQ